MENAANDSASSVDQQMAEVQEHLRRNREVINGLEQVPKQLETIAQQLRVWQDKAQNTLERIEEKEQTFESRLPELDPEAWRSWKEELRQKLLEEVRNNTEPKELLQQIGSLRESLKKIDDQLISFLSDNESYKTTAKRFNELADQLSAELDEFRTIKSELYRLIPQLELSKQQREQWHSQVAQLHSELADFETLQTQTLSQLIRDFQQDSLDKTQEAFSRRIAELEKANEAMWQKFDQKLSSWQDKFVGQIKALEEKLDELPAPTLPLEQPVCTHAGNPPENLFCIKCGQPVSVQKTIRQYQVLQTLAEGEMGSIYIACEKVQALAQPRQLLVLKEMNAEPAQITASTEILEQTKRTLKTLNHVGLPKFFDFFVWDEKKYLVMERIYGQNLEQRINQQGQVGLKQGIEWTIQICEVLTYIHNLEPPLIHGNIQPANLLLRSEDNRVFILDFRGVKEIGIPKGIRVRSQIYSSSELRHAQPKPQSDVYGVGATLIFMLTGKDPKDFYDWGDQGFKSKLEEVSEITPGLREVISRATEDRPEDRYQTAKELADALAACL